MKKQKSPYEAFDNYYPLTDVIEVYSKLWEDELSEVDEPLCDCKITCFKPNVNNDRSTVY